MTGKRVILVCATGMVGGHALRISLDDPDISEVTVLGRRSTGIGHVGLHEVIHEDFTDFSAVIDELAGQDAAIFCLGVYTGAVPDDEFRMITVDYTVAFAEALHNRSPHAAFCFLSGQGADRTERSRIAFARYKGAAENALLNTGFPRVHIFRPGYIYPVTPRKEPNITYSILRGMYPLIHRIYPNSSVSSDSLARAMVYAGIHGTGGFTGPILENRDIRELVRRI